MCNNLELSDKTSTAIAPIQHDVSFNGALGALLGAIASLITIALEGAHGRLQGCKLKWNFGGGTGIVESYFLLNRGFDRSL